MKLLSKYLLIAIIVLMSIGLSQIAPFPAYATDAQPAVYHPTVDTYVQGNSSTVKKNDQILDVKLKGANEGTNTTRVALLKFDYNDFAGNTVKQAKIRLYATTADTLQTRELKLSGIPYGSWDDNINSFGNIPTANATEIGRFSVSTSELPKWYEVDVTDYINSQMVAKMVSFKLEVTTAIDKSKVTFASNEATSNRPELVLYSPDPEPVNTPPVTTNVYNSGVAKVGGTLTGLYTFTDPDGDTEGTSTYKWLMADTENGTYSTITGATYKTLQLTSAHAGKFIKFEVTPVDAKGLAGEAKQSAAIAIEAVNLHEVYHPTVDTYVQGNSSTVKKNDQILDVKLKGANEGTNTTRVALLKFDYNDFAGNTVKQAKIRLYATTADTLQTRELKLSGIPYGSWDDNINSFGNIPTANATEIGRFSVSTSELPKWYEVDVTDYINSQMVAKMVSFKLEVTTAIDKSKVTFASNEATSNRPELVLYSPDPEPVNTPPVTTNVYNSGVAKVGGTLTGLYTFTDPDGDTEGTSTYKWLMADTENGTYSTITGATYKTLQLTSAHAGKFIKFEVTPVDAKGLAGEAKQSAAIAIEAVNTPPVTTNVYNSGVAKVGGTLTGLYTFTDPDGDTEGTSTYKWLMADTENGTYSTITGATYKTLQLTSVHAGKFIKFEVTPVDAKGLAGEAKQSAAIAIEAVNTPPVTTNVYNSGVAKVGGTLTGLYTFTDPDGDTEGTSTYKWLMADTENGTYSTITGATYKMLQLTSVHAGKFIKFEVTPVDAKGLAGEAKQSAAIAIEAANLHEVYHPTVDTYVQGNSSTVKKNDQILDVKLKGASEGTNTTRVALLKFDYNDFAGNTVKQAKIRLYATAADTLQIRELKLSGIPYGSWDDNINSLDNIPTANATEIGRFSVSNSELPKWYEVDVTDYINSQMVAKQVSFKLEVTTAIDKSKVTFASNEATNNRPELVLDRIGPAPTNTPPVASNVSISGVAKVGETLTGLYTFMDADGDAEGTSTYRWLMADTENGTYSDVADATYKTLQLTSAHAGKFIKFEVTTVDAKGLAGGAKQSAAIAITAVDEGKKFTVNASFNLSKLEPLKSLNANVTAVNTGNIDKDVLVIVALYNQNDEMVNLSYSSKKILAGQSEQIVAGFKLPGNVDRFNTKVFVWEGTDIKNSNMIPLSNIISLSS
ncbi:MULTISPECIES: CBM96 family carbohydrate-binding protein [unclassified Paenibacillus]|uniref:CBM96 family carbohydrate-binding protein n=1 Tax=unclassified Paenibacillus TaxID=185978 RepID=UPI00362C453B